MNWGSWSDFFRMGGYALYVWGSYVVTAVLIVAEIVLVAMRRRKVIAYLRLIHDDTRKVAQ